MSKKVTESYNKKMTTLKGASEETGMQRMIRERAQAAVQRASAKTQADVVKSLASLKVQTTAALDSISASLSSEIATLKEVQEAIKAEEGNLKNLHDITVEANSLQALQLANEDEKKAHEEEMELQRHLWAEEKTENVKQRQRDEEQYQYDTKKRHQAQEDQIITQRLQHQQAFEANLAAKTKAVTDRETVVASQEASFKALQDQVSKFDETLKKEVAASVAIATNALKKDLTHEHKVKELEFTNSIALKTAEIHQLNKQIAELQAQYKALDTEYKAATQKVQQIAEKAIDGAARQQTVVQMPVADSGNHSRK